MLCVSIHSFLPDNVLVSSVLVEECGLSDQELITPAYPTPPSPKMCRQPIKVESVVNINMSSKEVLESCKGWYFHFVVMQLSFLRAFIMQIHSFRTF